MTFLCAQCGRSYRVAEDAIGKRVRCKSCGTVSVVAARGRENTGAVAAPSPEKPKASTSSRRSSTGPNAAPATPEDAVVSPTLEDCGPIPLSLDAPVVDESLGAIERFGAVAGADATVPKPRSYVGDLLKNLTVFMQLRGVFWIGLMSFLLGGAALLLPFAGCIGLLGQVIIQGVYCAFLFECLACAAGGDLDVPDISMEGGWVDQYVRPLLKWAGSWIVALLPAIGYLAVLVVQGKLEIPVAALVFLVNPLCVLEAPEGVPLYPLFSLAAMAIWPIVALCAALDDWDILTRPDLVVRTIFGTAAGYVITVSFVVAGVAFDDFISQGAIFKGLGPWILAIFPIKVYADVTIMRAVGLYYFHFRKGFAWDWG